jgi:putative phosphoribosyl transferase
MYQKNMYHYLKDRREAALKLIPLLSKYKGEQGVVLAVPRGGVPVAYDIANYLNMPIELLMTKKIGHPTHPEFAIGAVSMKGYILEENLHVSSAYIAKEIETIRTSMKQRYKKFMGDRKPLDLRNKTIIIVDDGMATGNTILASLEMLKQQEPKKIIVAVPVAPLETVDKMNTQVDELICLYTPQPFGGVGLHYQNFEQVSDNEVIRLLKKANHFENA